MDHARIFFVTLHSVNPNKRNQVDRRNYFGLLAICLAMAAIILWTNRSTKKSGADMSASRQQTAITETVQEQNQEQEMPSFTTENTATAEPADSAAPLFYAMNGNARTVTLKNGKVSIDISTKGAIPVSAVLYGYKEQDGTDVTLFKQDEISLNFMIDGKNENIRTRDLYFEPVTQTDRSVVMRLAVQGHGYIDFSYELKPDSYLLDFSMQAHGMDNFFSTDLSSISMDWIQNLRQHEKGFEFEQRYTTLTYKLTDKVRSKIFGMRKTSSKTGVEEPVDWIAYKNQFFSCILASDQTFTGTSLSGLTYQKGKGYMKKFQTKAYTSFDPTGGVPTTMHFYFGPNDYALLKAESKLISSADRKFRLNRVIDLGWPVVREMNRFLIMPLFNLLSKWNLNMGIVILLMTLIVKALVFPAQFKSFMSSAKMRALKPYVDEISAKYPKPEDAMQKQQETMALYNKYGVGLMGGCLPSLVQMPVWMAFFFFVPNAIELRQESFLWATDLTGFDDIISWGKAIPLIGTHLSIFCVLFCVTNIINTVISMRQQQQAPGQEEQMKMMKWMMYLMPVIFFFSFNNYSSGLCYYYFISGLVSILTMIWLRRSTDEKEILAKLEANYQASRNDPQKQKKASSMMARLEAMQKEQQRLQEQQKRR